MTGAVAISVRAVSEADIHGLIFTLCLCFHSGKKSPHGLTTLMQPYTGLPVAEVIYWRVSGAVQRLCHRIIRVHDDQYPRQAQLDDRHALRNGHQRAGETGTVKRRGRRPP